MKTNNTEEMEMQNNEKKDQSAYAMEMYARPSEREDPFIFE